jgi:hypothetical protein
MGAHGGGVVLPAGLHAGGPDRPAVRRVVDLDVAAVLVVFARPLQIDALGGTG